MVTCRRRATCLPSWLASPDADPGGARGRGRAGVSGGVCAFFRREGTGIGVPAASAPAASAQLRRRRRRRRRVGARRAAVERLAQKLSETPRGSPAWLRRWPTTRTRSVAPSRSGQSLTRAGWDVRPLSGPRTATGPGTSPRRRIHRRCRPRRRRAGVAGIKTTYASRIARSTRKGAHAPESVGFPAPTRLLKAGGGRPGIVTRRARARPNSDTPPGLPVTWPGSRSRWRSPISR